MSVEWTQERLATLLTEWQERLRLQNWEVRVKFARGVEIPKREGECEYTQSCREALIRILHPMDWLSEDFQQDVEQCVVHELLHLHFAPFMSDKGPDDPAHIAQEQAIDAIAKALVATKRAALKGGDRSGRRSAGPVGD